MAVCAARSDDKALHHTGAHNGVPVPGGSGPKNMASPNFYVLKNERVSPRHLQTLLCVCAGMYSIIILYYFNSDEFHSLHWSGSKLLKSLSGQCD